MSTRILSGFTQRILPALLVLIAFIAQGGSLLPANPGPLRLTDIASEYNFTPASLSAADYGHYALLATAESTENESQEEESKPELLPGQLVFEPGMVRARLKTGTFTRFFSLTVPLYIRYHRWKTPGC